jgi:hypothetical protein
LKYLAPNIDEKSQLLIAPCTPSSLSTLSADAASKLDVFGHDGNTLGMDGAQVGVFKESDKAGERFVWHGPFCIAEGWKEKNNEVEMKCDVKCAVVPSLIT